MERRLRTLIRHFFSCTEAKERSAMNGGDDSTSHFPSCLLPTASAVYVNKCKALVTYKFHDYQHSWKQNGDSCIWCFYVYVKEYKQYNGYEKYTITGMYCQNLLLLIVSDAYTGFPSPLDTERRLVTLIVPCSSQMSLLGCESPFCFNDVVLNALEFASVHCLVHLMAGKTTRRAPHKTMKNPAR